MGEKSDSKKASSPYVVLENRPLDHWKVTELKEELKKRKLVTKGLKEDLVKRLDEAVRAEMDEAKRNLEDDLNSEAQPDVQSDDATVVPDVAEKTTDVMDHTEGKNEILEKDNMVEELDNQNKNDDRDVNMGRDKVQIDETWQSSAEKVVTEGEGSIVSTRVESFQVVKEVSVETTVLVSESMVSEELGGLESNMVSNKQPDNGELKPELQSLEEEPAKPGASDPPSGGNQVDEVSQVKSDSISVDTISNTEKNELKDNVIADGVKLELDVKPEVAQPSFTSMDIDGSKSESVEVDELQKDKASAEDKDVCNVEKMDVCKENNDLVADDVKLEPSSTNVVLDGGKSESIAVDEPLKDEVTVEEKYVNNTEIVDICKKNDSGDVGSSEKLNLDRSSGDDSMDEDALESKQVDSRFTSDKVEDTSEKIEVPLAKEDESVHVVVEDVTADKNSAPIDDKTGPNLISTKRKPHDQEAAGNSEIVKRQRKWNAEGLKVSGQQAANHSASTTPKDAFQAPAKRTFSRSESTADQESPKERVVPPSTKPPTTSLRIDNFLRPFTLKAVQELLGKTGTVVSFWMDHIKTHCYVTFTSMGSKIVALLLRRDLGAFFKAMAMFGKLADKLAYASAEEAIETRNAVCNLRWPVNGGRLLMADFVDPQEVKNRVDPPLPSPASTIPPAAMPHPPQPSPRLAVQKQQLPPPPSLPPPPPLSNPPPVRERALPPPPPPEKIDPPIVTLDDLFRKTRATPRIYYLPLSDEQVLAKRNSQGKA
ncbi:hypothetical protein OSB04_027674 [Centaurea solstitialis]|uniref:SAP domain-containing protein n=1 Tax=Centaurea solstitialis TaxID=347529 RepID=A0AA38SF27_9ASTR|nr:hypothetical protein OSB04_027674 [Centaurea solstitialis]